METKIKFWLISRNRQMNRKRYKPGIKNKKKKKTKIEEKSAATNH